MIVIPANVPFLMGSPRGENLIADKLDNEGPQHPVAITRTFAVAETELTFDEWDTCVTYGDCRQGVDEADWGRGQRPVINVTWDDAQRYVQWLSRITRRHYRLLTEAELEYATRAGAQTKYPWGNDLDRQHPHANCNGCGGQWENTLTAPVRSFETNGFNLYQMVGNVYEWVQDCYHSTYDGGPPLDGSEWTTGCPDKNVRIARNGSWTEDPDRVRSAVRIPFRKDRYFYWLGFRVARTLLP
jgi:formylglycine-generating enzyme required for sulfatase activity